MFKRDRGDGLFGGLLVCLLVGFKWAFGKLLVGFSVGFLVGFSVGFW